MPLTSGMKLGPYEILSPIGSGGMGEVYKARDTRLQRIVAIKVLPSNFSDDGTKKARFEREARTLSNLSHPNICTLHDIGRHNASDFIVMEYLEGETLAERIQKHALPLDELLKYASQIADALDKAHKLKVIHRDLKPHNIMITNSGVKLLDFGLAKFHESTTSGESQMVTRDQSLTSDGIIVGTLQYMAPEQLEGKEADERSDIFAFGATLYEMATGEKPFSGNTKASVIASILTTQPKRISELQPSLPPILAHIINKCLEKKPEDRWQCIQDLSSELKWIAASSPDIAKVEHSTHRPRSYERFIWGAIVAALAALVLFLYFNRSPLQRSVTLVVPPPENTMFDGSIALSQDGSNLAFVATNASGQNLIWIRSIDSPNARPVSGTEGAELPFWAPDGNSLGFFVEGKLKRISLTSQVSETLCMAPNPRGGSWNEDGTIIFSANNGAAIYRVSDKGGSKTIVTKLTESAASYRSPLFLPDNDHFLLFVIVNNVDVNQSGVYVGSLQSSETRRLVVAQSTGVYTSGNLLYIREGTLWSQSFDADKLKFTGEAFAVSEQPWYHGWIPGFSAFSGGNNTIAFRTGGVQKTQYVWFDRTGKQLGNFGPPGVYLEPALSPDEKRITTTAIFEGLNADILQFELARGTFTRFARESSVEATSIWSADGSRILYSSFPEGAFFEKLSNGSAKSNRLLKLDTFGPLDDWTPDGKFIVYTTLNFKTNDMDIWLLPLFGDKKPIPYLKTEFSESSGKVSPDSKWLAYESNETGRSEVYVQSFPSPENKIQVSTHGGVTPRWRKDGKELFYISPDLKMMSVQFSEDKFEPSIPTVLFQTQIARNIESRNHYVVTGDGQRFLININIKEIATAPINVLVNWPNSSKR